jgi:hypothetical protein
MIAVIALAAIRDLFRRPNISLAWYAYGWFWLLAASLWLLAGLRLLAYFFGYPRLDRFLFYGDEIFLAAHLVAGVMFLAELLWQNRRRTFWSAVFVGGLMVAFLILLLVLGIQKTTATSWASEHELPRAAFLAFAPGYLYCVFLMVYAVIAEFVTRLRAGAWRNGEFALAAAGMLFYALAGVADVRGIWAGWRLLLIRVIYLAAALTAFWIGRSGRRRVQVVRAYEVD